MKRIPLVAFIALVIFLIFFYQYNNNPAVAINRLRGRGGGEISNLRYRVYLFGIIPVGEAVFDSGREERLGNKTVRHLSAKAESLGFYSAFFRGNAILDSYLDEHSNPTLFKQKLTLSGRPQLQKEVNYNQKEGWMAIAGVRRQILPNTQDPLSLIFNFRRMDFDKTAEFDINLNTNQKNYMVKGNVEKNGPGLFRVRANISRRDKNPYHKSSITMFFFSEKENIPVLLKVFASGALINARLIEAK